MFLPNTRYEILTPVGFRSFRGLHFITNETISIFAKDVCLLEGSPLHRVLTANGYVTLEELTAGNVLISKGASVVVDRIARGTTRMLFDPVDVDHPEQAFYTNDVVSHNCSFQGSSNTLIPAKKLAQMSFVTPIEISGPLKIYARPIRASDEGPAHIYVATVDVSQGQDLDYSVMSIFDVSISPFRQVAVYRQNSLSPQLFAPIVKDLGEYYCNAFILAEVNDVGMIVADMLHSELEYENILFIRAHPKRGQILGGGFHPKSRLGLKMTQATKRVGCAGLRAMVDKDQLLIVDYDTIRELTTFVANGDRWEAQPPAHDDTVMTLVILGWLTGQQGFENYVGLSMRKMLMNQYVPVTLDEPFEGIIDATFVTLHETVNDGQAVWDVEPDRDDFW
tara:strand:+ start:5392 stop:6570 length:1179 start_codon:yes stop_codon:yes gene_type:complete